MKSDILHPITLRVQNGQFETYTSTHAYSRIFHVSDKCLHLAEWALTKSTIAFGVEFGYPEHITPEMLRDAEERQPSAKAAVSRILSKTWQTMPEIIENDASEDKVNTPWEKVVNKIMRRAFPAIIDADKKNLINRYSAVIIRFRDSRTLDQPVDTAALKRQKEKAIVGYTLCMGRTVATH